MSEEMEGTKSIFNEAVLKMQRIHDCQKIINDIRTNLLAYNIEYQKYNYEVYASQILNLFAEVMAKLDKGTELTETKASRKELLDALESCNIIEKKEVKSFSGVRIQVTRNNDNWKKLRDILLDSEDLARDLINKHGMSTPDFEEEGGWD